MALQEISFWILNTTGYTVCAGGCCFLLYQPLVPSSWCWIAADSSVQSLLFCQPFLAHQVLALSVKKLLSPVYPYLGLSASASSASIPPFHTTAVAFQHFWAFFHTSPLVQGRLPDVMETSVCCVLDRNLLLYFLKPAIWPGQGFPLGLPSSFFFHLLFSSYLFPVE